jgi:hypothetical protein
VEDVIRGRIELHGNRPGTVESLSEVTTTLIYTCITLPEEVPPLFGSIRSEGAHIPGTEQP